VVEPNPVTRMLEIGQIDGVGIVGCKLTYPDTRLQHVGLVLLPSGPTHAWIGKPAKDPGYFGSTLTPRNYLAVTAAAMLVRATVFDELDGFDEVFARDFNDVDFCLRAHRAGHRIAWTPYAHLTHHEGASMARRKADPRESAMFTERWGTIYPLDPYYSPALNPALERIYEAL
jgi:GT2 family glycosyltransferase